MKKTLAITLLYYTLPIISFAADTSNYELLAPFPGQPRQITSLSDYLIALFWLILGSAVVLAVVMIVVGGIEYMLAGLPSSKQKGKDRITGAVMGLLLALSSYLILRAVNPQLLITGFNLQDMSVQRTK